MAKRVLSAAEATAILNSTGLLENVCVDVREGPLELTHPQAVIRDVEFIDGRTGREYWRGYWAGVGVCIAGNLIGLTAITLWEVLR